jgi:hypothetical protein
MEEQASLTLETEQSERPVDRLPPAPPSDSPSTVLGLIAWRRSTNICARSWRKRIWISPIPMNRGTAAAS